MKHNVNQQQFWSEHNHHQRQRLAKTIRSAHISFQNFWTEKKIEIKFFTFQRTFSVSFVVVIVDWDTLVSKTWILNFFSKKTKINYWNYGFLVQ